MLPCARITSVRFKGTFSVGVHVCHATNTPSECAIVGADCILDGWQILSRECEHD
jgi:hypothetical protein